MGALRNRIKSAIWPFLAKPWHAPDMELHYGLWIGVSALMSQSGRQLGEENTRPFRLNRHLPAETITCKYQGSRHGRLINMSALRIAMSNFAPALAITGAVRDYHLHRRKAVGPVGLWDLYIISRVSVAIVAYQQRSRAQGAAPDAIPDALASQYQFVSGIFMVCRDMMNAGNPDIATNSPITVDQFFDYADRHGIFLSFNGMACAGSEKKIRDFVAFCIHGPAATDMALPPTLSMDQLVGDPANWYRYALATVDLDCFLEGARMRLARDADPHQAAHFDEVAAIYSALSRYCSDIASAAAPDLLPTDVGEGALARQNAILQLLGRASLARISDKHLAERLSN